MSPLAHVGIEYGDLGLNVAVLAGGALRSLNLSSDEFEKLVAFDPDSRASPLGVSFPSIFRHLGTAEMASFESTIQQFFRLLYRTIESHFRSGFGGTIIAVPTGLTSMRREFLVNCAQAAGFAGVELVDAMIPSAIVFGGGREKATTQLVYYVGYSDCEYALLRVVRGRIKVIDSGIASSNSGEAFDLQLMESIILGLREKNIFLGLKRFRMKQWLQFRDLAHRARKELSKKTVVDMILPPSLVNDAVPIRITLSGVGLAARLAPVVGSTIDDLKALLERNDVRPETLDAVIALGDTATRNPVAALLAAAFPGKVMIGEVGAVAAAAASYSEWLERSSTDGAELDIDLSYYLAPYKDLRNFVPYPLDAGSEAPPVVSAIVVEAGDEASAAVVDRPPRPAADGSAEPPHPAMPAAPKPSAEAAKELIEQGRYREAAELLQRLDTAEAPGAVARTAALSPARVLLQQAQDLLDHGRTEEAIARSHRAFAESSGDATILADMLRLHMAAASTLSEPEQYEQAIAFLICAHAHDETNREVHRALAERHVRHALAMLGQNDRVAAAEAAAQAVRFDPKDPQAMALFERLGGGRSRTGE